jgi:thiol:disulfide interchange protein DsbC
MIQGEMLDLKERRSLSEPRRQEARLSTIGAVSEKSMLIYPAKGQKKHVITVFTDIDCGYCRRLHQHMAEMNEQGIEVHYLFMPRAGLDSDSYRKAVAVWCAEEPRQAMTEAKLGKNVSYKECANPVRDHMALAEEMGVNATPTIITGKGSLWPGYLPPGELLQRLESEEAPVQTKK